MMFNVKVSVLVLAQGGSDYVERLLQLPFVPFVGLELAFSPQEESPREVTSVRWIHSEQRFDVLLTDHNDHHSTIDLIQSLYVAEGWSIGASN